MPVPTRLPKVFLPPAAAHVPQQPEAKQKQRWAHQPEATEAANAEALEEAQQPEANEEAKMGTPKRFRLVPEQTKKPKETKAKKSEPRKPKETQTKKPKEPKETKQRAKRQTKKEQDEQAVNKVFASPAWGGYLSARIPAEVDKKMKSAKLDRVYKKAEK